jgi:hypothetical protein
VKLTVAVDCLGVQIFFSGFESDLFLAHDIALLHTKADFRLVSISPTSFMAMTLKSLSILSTIQMALVIRGLFICFAYPQSKKSFF